MMKNAYVRLGVSIVILILFAGGIGFFASNGLKLFGFEIRSFNGYSKTLASITGTENKFQTAADSQKLKLEELEKAKKDFAKEKKEYEYISQDTINNIKEVTKKEKYSIEYLWIRIGQYARKYNVQVALIEPGSTVSTETPKTEGENTGTNTDTNAGTNTGTNTGNQQTPPAGETQIPTEGQKPNAGENNEQNNSSANYRIDALGNYDKIADFVYAIETDETLRFKLDNINMQPSGSQVKAIFEIKNLDIVK